MPSRAKSFRYAMVLTRMSSIPVGVTTTLTALTRSGATTTATDEAAASSVDGHKAATDEADASSVDGHIRPPGTRGGSIS